MTFLNIDSLNQFQIQLQTLVGRSVAVLGITGSGKTNTAAVLIEELLSDGLPLTVVDIEGEYWGLKEKFNVLVAGRSQHAELEVGPSQAAQLAAFSLKRGISIILDLSDFTQDEASQFLIQYFSSLWAVSTSLKQPYQIVLEEAHEFVPQGTGTSLKQILTRIALRGRKRGLGIILVSQRSAKVEKDVLTQTSLLFLHKVVHPIDLKVYKDLIPLPAAKVEEMIRKLEPGEAAVIFNHQVQLVSIRHRYTFHVGSTPMYDMVKHPKLRKIDDAMLRELRAMIAVSNSELSKDERSKMISRIKQLEELIVSKDSEIRRLKEQIELLSRLSISLEELPKGVRLSRKQFLEVDQAIIHQVKTNFNGSVAHDLTDSAPELMAKNELSRGLSLTSIDERRLNSLIKRIQKLPKLQLSILHLLIEHEGATMTVPMIASWLSLKENTIRSRPPHDLMKMKLITRVRGSRGFKYASTVSSFLQNEFPQVEMTILLRRLLDL